MYRSPPEFPVLGFSACPLTLSSWAEMFFFKLVGPKCTTPALGSGHFIRAILHVARARSGAPFPMGEEAGSGGGQQGRARAARMARRATAPKLRDERRTDSESFGQDGASTTTPLGSGRSRRGVLCAGTIANGAARCCCYPPIFSTKGRGSNPASENGDKKREGTQLPAVCRFGHQ